MGSWAHDQEILLSQGYVFDQNFLSQGYPIKNRSRTPCQQFFGVSPPPPPPGIHRTTTCPNTSWCLANSRHNTDYSITHIFYRVSFFFVAIHYFKLAYLSKVPWIFPGAPLKVNGAPGDIQDKLTGPNYLYWSDGLIEIEQGHDKFKGNA